MNKRRVSLLIGLGLVAGAIAAAWIRIDQQLTPMPAGQPIYVRYPKVVRMAVAFEDLQEKGIVRDAAAMNIYGWLHKAPGRVAVGTYMLRPGETPEQIVSTFGKPISQLVRIPETNWARRTANVLEMHQVTTAKEYLDLVKDPDQFSKDVEFPLPNKTLEGYLYPDTYDLPPLLGARGVVLRQLHAFDEKVWRRLKEPKNLDKAIVIASLVELEAGTDKDRPMIAGVIQNRLKKGMPLQIDAGIEYALGKWRRLYFKDYKNVKSPYNLYLHKGLPPTPICSPSFASIDAALHPAQHNYLYYVAMPSGESIYAATPQQHEHNIRLRKLALAAIEKKKKDLVGGVH